MKKTVKLFFIHPVDKPINENGGLYGAQRRNGRTHKGLDYLAPLNTVVKASEKGKVVYLGNRPYSPGGNNNLGNTIVIEHAPYDLPGPADVLATQRHVYTLYAHLNSMSVFMHKRVIQGETIGASGNSGMKAAYEGKKSGFHLHFEVRDSEKKMGWETGWPMIGNHKNPIDYLGRITTVEYELPDDKETGTGIGFPS